MSNIQQYFKKVTSAKMQFLLNPDVLAHVCFGCQGTGISQQNYH
jgi:hypothetical protein